MYNSICYLYSKSVDIVQIMPCKTLLTHVFTAM